MENKINNFTKKPPPPIFIKTEIQYYQLYYEGIKKIIEPNEKFTCKSSVNALKLNTFSSHYKIPKRKKCRFFHLSTK